MPIDEGPLEISCARGSTYICAHVCACVYAYGVSTCTCMYISCTVLSAMWRVGRQGSDSKQTWVSPTSSPRLEQPKGRDGQE